MKIIVIVCLCLMAVMLIKALYNIFKADRATKLMYIKNFKTGNFLFIYIIAVPLYFMGLYTSGDGIIMAVLNSILKGIGLAVLNYSYSDVSALMNTSLLYSIAMYSCFIIATLNAFLFAFTFIGFNILNRIKRSFIFKLRKKIYIIVGFNDQTADMGSKIKDSCIFFSPLTAEEKQRLFVLNRSYYEYPYTADFDRLLKKLIKNICSKQLKIIVNTGDDTKNLMLTQEISRLITECPSFVNGSTDCCINAYIFCGTENQSSFIHFTEKTKGCIQTVNKYKLIAMDFIDKYPITRFMDERYINYSKAVLKDNVDINIIMIGFGKTNMQLFLTSVANNQVIKEDAGGYKGYPIKYHIFDKKDSENHKNLNHSYNRYSNTFPENDKESEGYLELPDKPASVFFNCIDVNDADFYKEIEKCVKPAAKQLSYNYIIISFGSDLENLDLAEKFSQKIKEWELYDTTRIFVKIRDIALSKNVIEKELCEGKLYHVFGNEREIVYNTDKIINERFESMAKLRHFAYAVENNRNNLSREEVIKDANIKWYRAWKEVQRESNIFACLSLRLKLNLLGFDYADISNPFEDKSAEFMQNYTNDEPLIYRGIINGKHIVDYSGEYNNISARTALAFQEHLRWNSYMICNGFIPAKIDSIKKKSKAELMEIRCHGNLTTMGGLKEYSKIMAEVNNTSLKDEDVKKYDYQLMDDASWLLENSGFKIIDKKQ